MKKYFLSFIGYDFINFLIHPVKTTQFFENEMLAPLPLPLERVSRTREMLFPSTPNSHRFLIRFSEPGTSGDF